MFELGVAYELGLGVPEDEGEAESWFRRAAELGNMKAAGKLE